MSKIINSFSIIFVVSRNHRILTWIPFNTPVLFTAQGKKESLKKQEHLPQIKEEKQDEM